MIAQTIKIGIPGAAGRMGRMLIREIDAAPDLELVAASESDFRTVGIDKKSATEPSVCRNGSCGCCGGHIERWRSL